MAMNAKRLALGVGTCVVLLITSCNTDPDVPDQYQRHLDEIAAIDAELAVRGGAILRDPSGVRMIITQLGDKLPAQETNKIDVDYVGKRFSDKFEFDRGTASLTLSSYIAGWRIALSKLPAGSIATIIIPSGYGYGATAQGTDIPANSILEFDVQFHEAIPTTAEVQKLASDTVAIDQYLASKSITAVKDTTGIRYVISQEGSGPIPSWFTRLTLKYNIKLLTDDTREIVAIEREPNDDFYSRPVDYIHGLKIGLQKLRVGSKAVFYVPSGHAFGTAGASDPSSGASIPANANLIIEVELINAE
ncbi:MAG TPA: FKBP-type peptidyl-prolyl cis-trans isomerase [Chryseolinea sp.]|nr:FKBP-type peptidyl-prolyl cis-trans isomerase [Chryseolinea sp.]